MSHEFVGVGLSTTITKRLARQTGLGKKADGLYS
jgi:hypothetical protein